MRQQRLTVLLELVSERGQVSIKEVTETLAAPTVERPRSDRAYELRLQ